MGLKCLVCGDYSTKQSKESFHRFPVNVELRSAWLKATRVQEHNLKSNSAVCSRHFREIDYDPYAWPVRKLLQNIVPCPSLTYYKNLPSTVNSKQILAITPSIPILKGNHPPVLPLTINAVQQENNNNSDSQTNVKRENVTSEVSQNSAAISDIAKAKPLDQMSRRIGEARYVGDLTEDDFSTPAQKKRNLELIFKTVNQQKQKIKRLRSAKLSLEKRLNNMKNMVQTLRKDSIFIRKSKCSR